MEAWSKNENILGRVQGRCCSFGELPLRFKVGELLKVCRIIIAEGMIWREEDGGDNIQVAETIYGLFELRRLIF